jgi:hypothetical protein
VAIKSNAAAEREIRMIKLRQKISRRHPNSHRSESLLHDPLLSGAPQPTRHQFLGSTHRARRTATLASKSSMNLTSHVEKRK